LARPKGWSTGTRRSFRSPVPPGAAMRPQKKSTFAALPKLIDCALNAHGFEAATFDKKNKKIQIVVDILY
jgi:hypothetical protein